VRTTADLPYELIVQPSREGMAANRNAGLDVATQDLIVFIDDDVLLPA
jgi:glycosyltransferase involved in cell wall biosynthesis